MSLRILGIDPGSVITGYGVVDFAGDTPRHVASGSIRTGGGEFPARLRVIHDAIIELVAQYRPGEVAVERVFVSRNADSALKLGQARAAAICGTFADELPLFEYSPREIKQAVVGRGGAGKEQVAHMVRTLLLLREAPEPDAGDALGVALCHGFSRAARLRLAAAERRET